MECFYPYTASLPMIAGEAEPTQVQCTDSCGIKSTAQQRISKTDNPQHEGKPLMNTAISVMPYSEVNPYLTESETGIESSPFPSPEDVASVLMQGTSFLQGIVDLEQLRTQDSMERNRVWNIGNHSESDSGYTTSPLTQLLSKASPERSLVLDALLIDSQNFDRTYIVPECIDALEELEHVQYSVLTHHEQEMPQTHPSQSTTTFSSRKFHRNTPHHEVRAAIKQKTIELVAFARQHPAGNRSEPADQGAVRPESAISFPAIIHQITGVMVSSMAHKHIAFMIIPTRESYILIGNLFAPSGTHKRPLNPPARVLMNFHPSIPMKKVHKAYKELARSLKDIHAGFYSIHFENLDQLFSSFSFRKKFNDLTEKSITDHRCKIVNIQTKHPS